MGDTLNNLLSTVQAKHIDLIEEHFMPYAQLLNNLFQSQDSDYMELEQAIHAYGNAAYETIEEIARTTYGGDFENFQGVLQEAEKVSSTLPQFQGLEVARKCYEEDREKNLESNHALTIFQMMYERTLRLIINHIPEKFRVTASSGPQ